VPNHARWKRHPSSDRPQRLEHDHAKFCHDSSSRDRERFQRSMGRGARIQVVRVDATPGATLK
jgi:hypothetical protein